VPIGWSPVLSMICWYMLYGVVPELPLAMLSNQASVSALSTVASICCPRT
jgi:hypothetical protein